MKTVNIIIAILVVALVASCKPGKIRVQNNISQVVITNVQWGDQYLAYELLPGETSDKLSISDVPESNKIRFVMQANNQAIYLETEELYHLDRNDDLLIVITDSTPVKNPNE
ncbi:MAG: hypothetical protein EOM83_12840 [Clostridia bacterium]|nr:hypothetical protein [Clostridia bacterium]